MIRLRATKYDPGKRDRQGRYLADEFTSCSDVGRKFGGHVLSPDAYVVIEDAYVACVSRLLAACGVEFLRVSELEDRTREGRVASRIESIRPASLDGLCDDRLLEGDLIGSIVRMNLREVIWCKLSGPKGIYVHFGYDFYMYLGSDSQGAALGSPPVGMFYEECESPYA